MKVDCVLYWSLLRPPKSTRTVTLVPDTPLFRSGQRRGKHEPPLRVTGAAARRKRAVRRGRPGSGGAAGNRTRVLERRTRSSPGAVSDVAFLGPGARTDTSPTGSVRKKSRAILLTGIDQQAF